MSNFCEVFTDPYEAGDDDCIFYKDKTKEEKNEYLEVITTRLNALFERLDKYGAILLHFNLDDINDMIKVATGFVECMEKEEEKEIANKLLQLLNMIKEQMEVNDSNGTV